MNRVARSYWAFLRAHVSLMLQYRGEIMLWAVWGLVNPAVLYAVWGAAAEGSASGGIAGFSRGQFAAYYFMIMVVGHLSTAWDTFEIGYLVRSGRMSPKLLRPVLPVWEALSANTAYKVATLAFVVPMWCLFAWLVRPEFHAAPWQIGLGAVAIVMAALLNFVMGYVVALVAFWSPKMDATGEIYFGVSMFLGGRFAPLSALPGPILVLAEALPFRWMFAFPAELTMGRIVDPAEAFRGLGMQALWLVLAVAAFRVTWRAAVKRYTAVSG